jgi:hypothetical protein
MNTRTLSLLLCGVLGLGCSSGTDKGTPPITTGGSGPPAGTGGGGGTPPPAYGGSGGNGGSGGQTPIAGSGGSGGESGGSGGSASPGDAGTPPATGGDDGGSGTPVSFPGMHPKCPNCKSIFDGKTLTGWTSYAKVEVAVGPAPGNWDVVDGALHSVGTRRGVLATNDDYGDFRLIFSIKHSGGGHQPCIVIWGMRPPPNDAMGGIQIQAPHTNMWDYRPGKNANINGMKVGTTAINDAQWSQCEVLAKATGEFRMACCQQDAAGNTPCKGVELLHFNVAGAGNKGPISLQAHNAGVHDSYKNIFIEASPAVDDLLTTK